MRDKENFIVMSSRFRTTAAAVWMRLPFRRLSLASRVMPSRPIELTSCYFSDVGEKYGVEE
jgi:hypothetical protein